jgi:hypothetical protein
MARRPFLYALVALPHWDRDVHDALLRSEIDVLRAPPEPRAGRVELTVALAAFDGADVFRGLSAALRRRFNVRPQDVLRVSSRNGGPPELP